MLLTNALRNGQTWWAKMSVTAISVRAEGLVKTVTAAAHNCDLELK
jgi:hypothetical protein